MAVLDKLHVGQSYDPATTARTPCPPTICAPRAHKLTQPHTHSLPLFSHTHTHTHQADLASKEALLSESGSVHGAQLEMWRGEATEVTHTLHYTSTHTYTHIHTHTHTNTHDGSGSATHTHINPPTQFMIKVTTHAHSHMHTHIHALAKACMAPH
jgi:hypothetical protein